MPGFGLQALFLFRVRMGLCVYIVIKQAVIYGAHTDLRWDKKLYEIKWMNPIMWILKGLYPHRQHIGCIMGNILVTRILTIRATMVIYYFWDVIFGTAKITRKYPKEVGVENLSEASH